MLAAHPGDLRIAHAAGEELPPDLVEALTLVPDRNLPEPDSHPCDQYDWDEAACRSQFVDEFYSDEATGVDGHARRVCASCPLQRQCMTYALAHEGWGLWCLTERERSAFGGVQGRQKRTAWTPRRAAEDAVAAGVDPYRLADALWSVFGAAAPSRRAGSGAAA